MWSRAYRRAFEKRQRDGVQDMSHDHEKIELVFRIRVIDIAREIEIQWLKGSDQVLWESFCGLVHRHFKTS